MSANESSADDIAATADYIATRGLLKRHYGANFNGPACILGALGVAGRASNWRRNIKAIEAVVGENPAIWNDRSRRTKQQVVDALLEAAARLRTHPERAEGRGR